MNAGVLGSTSASVPQNLHGDVARAFKAPENPNVSRIYVARYFYHDPNKTRPRFLRSFRARFPNVQGLNTRSRDAIWAPLPLPLHSDMHGLQTVIEISTICCLRFTLACIDMFQGPPDCPELLLAHTSPAHLALRHGWKGSDTHWCPGEQHS